MPVTRITWEKFTQAFDALCDRAQLDPMIISKNGRDALVLMSAGEWERLRRSDRRVGLTTGLGEEWVEAVRGAKVPAEFAHLDAELK